VPPLTVTVVAKNEAANIAAALESVRWADEIVVVVDAQSTDETAAIARRFTDRVVTRAWTGYTDQKNHAAELAAHEWILSLDSDERVTPELRVEVRALLSGEPGACGYRMPRASYYLGRWIRTTDWYPDYQLRLYDRRRGRWAGRHVHESVEVGGPIGTMRSDLQHVPYKDISDHVKTINRYSTLSARQMAERGRRAGLLDVVVRPPVAFLRNYVVRGGFRDAGPGLVVSLLNSYYVMLKFAKLWESTRTR
jgi:glycosyltransferase involved in cell wall biosynthesis